MSETEVKRIEQESHEMKWMYSQNSHFDTNC